MHKTFSVILYVASGFFLYTVEVLGFVNEPPVAAKLAIMGVFTVPAIGLLLFGLWASQFANWRRDIGIVMLSASLFTAFLALTVVCMIATPEFEQMFPDNKLAFFSDYITGCSLIALVAVIGGCLIWYPQRPESA
jgi:hypothetical protein